MASFEAFVFPDLTGVVVHDRYQNYDKFPGISHQLCCQHLLRDLADAAESYPAAIWPGQVTEALQALIHQANLAREQGLAGIPPQAIAPHLRLFRHGVLAGLSEVRRLPGANVQQPPARLLLECLHDRGDDVLRFLSDLRIPPTSNQAERDVRPAKTQQKISGRLRSEDATRHRYAIRGYISWRGLLFGPRVVLSTVREGGPVFGVAAMTRVGSEMPRWRGARLYVSSPRPRRAPSRSRAAMAVVQP
jgi:hypothetical protein